jgi:hypothetical protein
MNDFTKEELEIILEGILWRDTYVHPADRPEKLKSKLQSMIETFCEHKGKVSNCDDNGHMLVQCARCDFILWHEKD